VFPNCNRFVPLITSQIVSYDVFHTADSMQIVMEYMAGGMLADVITRDRKLSEEVWHATRCYRTETTITHLQCRTQNRLFANFSLQSNTCTILGSSTGTLSPTTSC